jgi:hypothetical protein
MLPMKKSLVSAPRSGSPTRLLYMPLALTLALPLFALLPRIRSNSLLLTHWGIV